MDPEVVLELEKIREEIFQRAMCRCQSEIRKLDSIDQRIRAVETLRKVYDWEFSQRGKPSSIGGKQRCH